MLWNILVGFDVEEIKRLLLNIGEFGDNRKNALQSVRQLYLVERAGGETGAQGAEADEGAAHCDLKYQ